MIVTESPTCLCNRANVAAPRTISWSALNGRPDKIGGFRRGVRVADQRRNGLSVELEVGELVVGPGRHIAIAVKETAHHRWQVAVVPDRGDGVVPVPSVQGRVGVEIVEAAPEGDGRHDDRHGNDGAEHHRARGTRAAVATPAQGEAQSGDRRLGEPHGGGQLRGARSPPSQNRLAPGAPLAALACREGDREGAQAEDEYEEARGEHRPVERDPRPRVDLARGSQRCQRREGDRHADGEKRSEDDGGERAERGVRRHDHGPRAQGSEDGHRLPIVTEHAGDGLTRDQECGQAGDEAEDAEGDGFGPVGPLHLALRHRRQVEVVERAVGEAVDDLPLHRRNIASAVVEPESIGRKATAGPQPFRHGGGHEHGVREAIHVVTDELAGKNDETHEGRGEMDGRPHSQEVPVRLLDLLHRVGPERDPLSDVPTGEPRHLGRRHELVRPVRIGPAARGDGQSILGEVFATAAPDKADVLHRNLGSDRAPI